MASDAEEVQAGRPGLDGELIAARGYHPLPDELSCGIQHFARSANRYFNREVVKARDGIESHLGGGCFCG
jgi:hypothetical protein